MEVKPYFDSLLGEIKIIVKKVQVEGKGVILLTGPSSCGKGEVAKALCKFLSLPAASHLSMGDILRSTLKRARQDSHFREILSTKYNISHTTSIFDIDRNTHEIISKAELYSESLIESYDKKRHRITQLDWLEFCVQQGLLVPDEWTIGILDAMLYNTIKLHDDIFILDGYPRTDKAAEFLLRTLADIRIPVIKVLHLSITKEQMKIRARARMRSDDSEDSLERRYQFYVDKVQPCIDYMKHKLGTSAVHLIDAHQPVYREDGGLDKDASIMEVVYCALQALGLPKYLTEI